MDWKWTEDDEEDFIEIEKNGNPNAMFTTLCQKPR